MLQSFLPNLGQLGHFISLPIMFLLSLSSPSFVYCCPVQVSSLLLCSPSLTDLIIEVSERSGRFPLLGWQSTVLLKPRISSGSPLKGVGRPPLPSPSSTVFPLNFHGQHYIVQSNSESCWLYVVWNSPRRCIPHFSEQMQLGDAMWPMSSTFLSFHPPVFTFCHI